MNTLLVIGLGSGIGGVLRYLLMLATNHMGSNSHIGTIAVNVLGCILLGVLAGMIDGGCHLNGNLRQFLIVGVCGGFTTFSTFVSDGFNLLHHGDVIQSLLYLCGSVVLGVVAFATAYYAAEMFQNKFL
ncbi:MAG: CrcB family protein [Bacteroidales bacterium]|nr:CrcB family protein [Bacteroidales bacterium]